MFKVNNKNTRIVYQKNMNKDKGNRLFIHFSLSAIINVIESFRVKETCGLNFISVEDTLFSVLCNI